ncbi:MAG: homoserine dehydrogenase [Candidatus Bathyarchaeia archaeon]
MGDDKTSYMKIQLVGLGNVGKSLLSLVREKQGTLKALGVDLTLVSISDSKGTAVDEKGLDLGKVLKHKDNRWKGASQYVNGYTASEAISDIESDVVVELTPSTPSGEPGLSHIRTALMMKKNVVTANKGPLVVAYSNLTKLARSNHVKLLYEATVAAHVPIFCLIDSCFRADELLSLQGILNATTNFIIGEMERGRDFQEALKYAIEAGWAETNYSDDVDGIDAARKVVMLANSLFKNDAKLENVKVEGIRNVGPMVEKAKELNRRVKLVCEISKRGTKLEMHVEPRLIPLDDPLATVNGGHMGLKLSFKTSQQVFVSAQFSGLRQTAYAVLNDLTKISPTVDVC